MTGTESEATLVFVDDEPGYLSAYASWTGERYDVRTATDGREALDAVDEAVDVVFLDRRMPGLSGDEVLDRIREAGYECQVAMLTAVEPTVDVVDMPFDEYIVKPVTRSDLRDAVENLLARARLDETTRRCFTLASKKAALEAAHDRSELDADPEYRRLCASLESAESEADRALHDLLSDGDLAAGYYDIES